ncbi:MAG TPA: response regulator [Verrucomicrobiae bacterium]|nr:response regulator [Verrucomicrobiae bacterium]
MTTEPTVLIAEDNENDIFLLRRALITANITLSIDIVRDGQEAIARLENGRMTEFFPQLVLLDLKMPKYKGFEVLKWIREQPHLKRLIVVVFSTSRFHEDINRAYDLGANSYLIKPSDMNELVSLLKEVQTYWLQTNNGPDLRRVEF